LLTDEPGRVDGHDVDDATLLIADPQRPLDYRRTKVKHGRSA